MIWIHSFYASAPQASSSRRDETLAAGTYVSKVAPRSSKFATELYLDSALRLLSLFGVAVHFWLCNFYASAPQASFKQERRDARRRRRHEQSRPSVIENRDRNVSEVGAIGLLTY